CSPMRPDRKVAGDVCRWSRLDINIVIKIFKNAVLDNNSGSHGVGFYTMGFCRTRNSCECAVLQNDNKTAGVCCGVNTIVITTVCNTSTTDTNINELYI